ncbi:acyl--CoA ligase [Streptomyces sp. NBC_01239]|uniref:class I adenylate-forming enzyme family protein n=1 Tax=Streptomyces sp. NBC_01239 TaxID=2903792 RepID=UPI0022521D9A|nr:class I adenylate-forming enzyme family protein [Streptomyces sp. NBC_01239]MCX4815198.1 acyl--CoA ligase [Streptomyces sp. NBC_01239]
MTKQARSLPVGRALPLLSNWLRRVMDIDPTATALTFAESEFPWSYFADVTRDLDALLRHCPTARRVGLVLRNRPAHTAALLATLATGRQIVTLSPHVGDQGLGDDIRSLRPDVVIADEEDWARDSVRDAAEHIRAVPLLASQEAGLRPRQAAWAASPAGLPVDDVAVLMMTSGTTGRPKRVSLTFAQLTAAFNAAGTVLDDSTDPRLRRGRVILWSSLAHISGLYFAVAHAVDGRSVALLERFNVEEWARLVRLHRPRQLRLPPTAIRMVLNAELPVDTFSSVRAIGSGTAPLPPELAEEFETRYGVPILTTYGATEFAGAIAGWSVADHREWSAAKRGSVGRAHRGIELRVVDRATQRVQAPGAIGLLEVRGPQLPASDGQWLRTNDLASLDEDGFLFIHGRADDAINRGGFKIPPSVIEEALHQHGAVSDASAFGIPDERLGEVPVVAVTLCAQASERELLDHLADRLTRYQMPVALRILDQLPRTPSLKVDRPRLQELFDGGTSAQAAPGEPATPA